MKPQRFWAVTFDGHFVEDQFWSSKDDAVSFRELCRHESMRVVRVEVRVVTPKPKKRKARKGAK